MVNSTTIERSWWRSDETLTVLRSPRNDLLSEIEVADEHLTAPAAGAQTLVFGQDHGPFTVYRRTLTVTADRVTETTEYQLVLPWFRWLFALPLRWFLERRGRGAPTHGMATNPWWAPPDQLDARQTKVLGLLAAAAMSAAFANTLFTQTATFAADSFGTSDTAFGVAGAVVRLGVIVALPLTILADRIGRRRVIRFAAWAAPLVCSLGAVAPTFPVLVATQTIGRPLGLALDLLIAIVAAEEMPKSSRAYAVSMMVIANGLGAGVAVWALPLADLGANGWRLVYVVSLLWVTVAISVARHLPETIRFERPHIIAPPIAYRRLVVLAAVVILANLFVAPASFFQNRYLSDVRGLNASLVTAFTLITATPAALGLVIGGKLADLRGRRRLIAVSLPVATLLILLSFYFGGAVMWFSAFGGGFIGGIAYPALAVYRTELFPTGNRGRANGLLVTSALIAGSLSILTVGAFVERGFNYGPTLTVAACGQLAVVLIVVTQFPESAHTELEELNDVDDVAPPASITRQAAAKPRTTG